MKVYLAGGGWEKRLWMNDNFYDFYRLHTFYEIKEHEANVVKNYKDFLLDSGAFSFMGGKKVNWNNYVSDYINFINKYDIKHFFELDIYSVIGITETKEIRRKIESKTGKKIIPVWHIFLGTEYYKWMVENYEYIAIGASGLHDSKWTRTNPEKLKALVQYANKNNVKVHGLGYTNMNGLKNIPFYSVDSTSWLSGNRFGAIYQFNGYGFNKKGKPKGMRVKTDMTARNNFYEWVKFQKYAETNL